MMVLLSEVTSLGHDHRLVTTTCTSLYHEIQELDSYRSQSWEVRETVSLGYPKLMVN
jgi:hypothetical protein